MHVSYPIQAGRRLRVLLQADVFNLLDRQAATILDQRYNLIQDEPCAGIPEELCNGDGGLVTRPGTLDPAGSLPDVRSSATNPDFLRSANTFTAPRSLRLGIRLSF